MKPTPHIALIIIVILLIVSGGAYFLIVSKAHAPTQPSVVATSTAQTSDSASNQNVVTYFCDEGSFTATFLDSTLPTSRVSLVLPGNQTIVLPQVQSGSGIRYEQGAGTSNDVQFSSEGANAFLMQGTKTTYNNCLAASVTINTDGTHTFTDAGKLFSFTYPSTVQIAGGGIGYSTDWMVNATTSGMLLAKATLPRTVQPKTNFSGATFTVGTSADDDAVTGCLTNALSGAGTSKGVATIHGITFTKFETSDAGAGNFYDTTSYRTVHNNQCYAIEYTIHSTYIGNYSPDQGISAFDKASVQKTLEQMAQSFTFK